MGKYATDVLVGFAFSTRRVNNLKDFWSLQGLSRGKKLQCVYETVQKTMLSTKTQRFIHTVYSLQICTIFVMILNEFQNIQLNYYCDNKSLQIYNVIELFDPIKFFSSTLPLLVFVRIMLLPHVSRMVYSCLAVWLLR